VYFENVEIDLQRFFNDQRFLSAGVTHQALDKNAGSVADEPSHEIHANRRKAEVFQHRV